MSYLKLEKKKLINTVVSLPLSKSIRNRKLILTHLAGEPVKVDADREADDSVLLQKHLDTLHQVSDTELVQLDCKNAGTAFRFLTAVCCLRYGESVLTGSERMQNRPVKDLVDPLIQMGADISYLGKEGYPPLAIKGGNLRMDDLLKVRSGVSSQYLSALLLIAPFLDSPLRLAYNPAMPSASYVEMTLQVLEDAGVQLQVRDDEIEVLSGVGKVLQDVERDWSSAAFFYSMVALSDDLDLSFPALSQESWQGDSVTEHIFSSLGVETTAYDDGVQIRKIPLESRHFTYCFADCPDLALPVIACCAGLGVVGKFSGLRNLKFKESDRLRVLINELTRLGYDLREVDDDEAVLINPCEAAPEEQKHPDVHLKTYSDHRMAMSLAPLVLKHERLAIENPEVVKKSFPAFWTELEKCGVKIST